MRKFRETIPVHFANTIAYNQNPKCDMMFVAAADLIIEADLETQGNLESSFCIQQGSKMVNLVH